METVKIIGRISKAGKEYLQTAVKDGEKTVWLPVFLKKGVEKLNFERMEKKFDKRGVAYTLYEVNAKNVYFPEVNPEDEKDIRKVIIMK